jgi:hypothetical protein
MGKTPMPMRPMHATDDFCSPHAVTDSVAGTMASPASTPSGSADWETATSGDHAVEPTAAEHDRKAVGLM